METLTRLFGNATKVKIIKLFVFNPDTAFDISDIADRTKEGQTKIRKEMGNILKSRLVRKKVFYKTVVKRVRKKKVYKKVKSNGFILNDGFEHLVPLQTFLISLNHLGAKDIVRRLGKSGTVRLVIVAGVFIHDPDSRVDLLVVGDNIRKAVLDSAIHNIESEMGREIRYAYFDTTDFKYRLGLYDKLIRDILDYPHEEIFNKIGSI